MDFLEILKLLFLFAAVVMLIIGFCFEPDVIKIEKALWRTFKLWLAEKMRSSKRLMRWLNDEKAAGETYVFKVKIINGWQNERY